MKTTILISLLCLGSLAGNAQTQFQYSTKDNPPLVNNGKRIPVNPAFDAPFKVVSDTPCYMYKKNGLVVVDCPGVWFTPQTVTNEDINVQSQGTYMGNYPESKVEAPIPANAVPVYPKGAYTPLTDGAPCYQYKTKKGLQVMECHGLWFPPESKSK
ncbi:MAG: hypothetical protein JWQ38_995 [Flavipsychrobacter sp.]|nr:hypothetical protein [Flavipsychrobacter sp.]